MKSKAAALLSLILLSSPVPAGPQSKPQTTPSAEQTLKRQCGNHIRAALSMSFYARYCGLNRNTAAHYNALADIADRRSREQQCNQLISEDDRTIIAFPIETAVETIKEFPQEMCPELKTAAEYYAPQYRIR